MPVLFQEMQNGCGLAPSVSSYGHLVAAYGQMGRWEEAVALVAAVCRWAGERATSNGMGGWCK